VSTGSHDHNVLRLRWHRQRYYRFFGMTLAIVSIRPTNSL
jgi:hypothetical protein